MFSFDSSLLVGNISLSTADDSVLEEQSPEQIAEGNVRKCVEGMDWFPPMRFSPFQSATRKGRGGSISAIESACLLSVFHISFLSCVRYLFPYVLQPFPSRPACTPYYVVLTFRSFGLGSYLRAHICHSYPGPLSCRPHLISLSLSSITLSFRSSLSPSLRLQSMSSSQLPARVVSGSTTPLHTQHLVIPHKSCARTQTCNVTAEMRWQ